MRQATFVLAILQLAVIVSLADSSQTTGGNSKKSPSGTVAKSTGNSAQQQNLAKLKSDLEAIRQMSQVTSQMKQAVVQDLQQILSAANKPSQSSIQNLANDLTKAVADGKISTSETIKLTQDISAVLSSANISQQSAQKLMSDVQTLLKATNLTQADAQKIQQDVQAILQSAQQHKSTTQTKKK